MNPNDNFKILRAKVLWTGEYVILCHLPDNKITPYAIWVSNDLIGTIRERGRYFFEDQFASATTQFEDYGSP